MVTTTAAYLKTIESRINYFFDSNLLNWESKISQLIWKRPSPFMISFVELISISFLIYILISTLSYFCFLPYFLRQYVVPKYNDICNYIIIFTYIIMPVSISIILIYLGSELKSLPDKINEIIAPPIAGEAAPKK